MRVEGTYEFDAPRDLVWEMLLDSEVLAGIMPGCQALDKIGDDEYSGKIQIKVGPVQGAFQGKVKLSEMQPPERYVMQVNARGPAGIVDGKGDVRLEADGDKTIMHYGGDANVSGRVASVGQRVMDASARAITQQSLDNLNLQVEARMAALSAATVAEEAESDQEVEIPVDEPAAAAEEATVESKVTPAAAPAPSQREFASGVARAVIDEFIPRTVQPWLLGGIAVLVLYLLIRWLM